MPPPVRRRWLGAAFAVLLVLTTIAGAVRNESLRRYDFPGPLQAQTAVVVPHGSPEQVAAALRDAGVIGSAWEFRAAVLLTGGDGPLHAAELSFPRGATLREVLAILRSGRPVSHRLTVPEGLTAAQIARLLDAADEATGDTPVPAEGAVLPETYVYERGATRAALLARATAAMDRALAGVWAARTADLPLATSRDLLTLASIVERETARPDERSRIAAVFLNRLRQGMRLQSDPTVIYAVSGGSGMLGRALSRADLGWANPYNTYAVAGLPPGPIDSPGLAALQATAHPADTDALYFVADGNGGHAFARTLEDHQRNVQRWRALRAAEGPAR